MTNQNNKYRQYFDIDEQYFPQINDSVINNNPDVWTNTYPHETFIEMLVKMERILSRQEKRSLWIEGAYGAGKSQCAYALKKILEVSEDELKSYWDEYEPLREKADLLKKIISQKNEGAGILTIYRYASGSIRHPRDLFFALQASIKDELKKKGLYEGEKTLKDSVIAWLEDEDHKKMFDSLLQNAKKEWKGLFSQSNADEILDSLKKDSDQKNLMGNIFRLADKEGISALNIDAERLLSWLTDIIDSNKIKIVFIWDEFSDYFKNNRDSLSDFQRIAELVNSKPFYFIIVTHDSAGQIFASTDETGKKVRDRFIGTSISMPDNTAFDLIGHAFKIKQAAKNDWDTCAETLNKRVKTPRDRVMSEAKIKEERTMKNIMPLHPMSALFLKHIAGAFKSNQRSMFDFIKSSNTQDKAFQWFVENYGPYDNHPILTADMLWNFFYEQGRNNLDTDIKQILDIFAQQENLRADESAVLKAVLIMQALDKKLGGAVNLFKATEQNLSYVFGGISNLDESNAANIARKLASEEKGRILTATPIKGGQNVYSAPVFPGDSGDIEKRKKEILQNTQTSTLVNEGGLSDVLALSSALKLRFETESETGPKDILPVTSANFTRTINYMREKSASENHIFRAVIAFAKDESETAVLRKNIKDASADEKYKNIVFIDALSTPLGQKAFEEYAQYQALASYYQGKDNNLSRQHSDSAKQVLQAWKTNIYNGSFIVYSNSRQGEKFGNGQDCTNFLKTIVTDRFHYVFDFAKGITQSQLVPSAMKHSALCGITQNSSRIVLDLEKHILPTVWNIDKYWLQPNLSTFPISKIKIALDKLIDAAFESDGQISIGAVYDFLEKEYGFAPCNLYSFIVGFLLKEYSSDPYRYSDSSGAHAEMTPDKLAEMIGGYIGKYPKPKETFIVKMTPDEKMFYELTEKAWGLEPNSCSSPDQAGRAITIKMRSLKLPCWVLKEIADEDVWEALEKYIELVTKEGADAHNKAIEIGKLAQEKAALAEKLSALLTIDNCKKGLRQYLSRFENGKLLELAKSIDAQNNIDDDIAALFEVEFSCLWNKKIGEDEIRKLLIEYGIVKESNSILNVGGHCLSETFNQWRERLNFIGISYEAAPTNRPELSKFLIALLKIYKQDKLLFDDLKLLFEEMQKHNGQIKDLFNNADRLFAEVYAPYLEGLNNDDIANIKSMLPTSLFELSKTQCNAKVKEAAEEFKKNQLKSQLFCAWKDKTETKNPREWSRHFRTPILSCIPENEYEKAKRAFETLIWGAKSDDEIKEALDFIKSSNVFEKLGNKDERDAAFKRDVLGEFAPLLVDIDKVRDALENLNVDVYDWRANPHVKAKVKALAKAQYDAGASDKILKAIDKMDDVQLRSSLKRLVKDNIKVGIEILSAEDGQNVY
jgi:hypothetical protein